MLHSFTIADLGLLNATKDQALFLNNQALFTEGRSGLTRGALLSPLSAITGVFTTVCSAANGLALLGQVKHRAEDAVAYWRFVAPHSAVDSAALPELVEYLLKRVGARGAQSLVADVEEGSPIFEALRKFGFSIYARQRVWKLDALPHRDPAPSMWRPAFDRDQLAVQLLRNRLLTGQVQQIETDVVSPQDGYVYYRQGQLLAFVEVKRGKRGIWVQPFVDLDAEPFDDVLVSLLTKLRPRPSRPIYILVRSYQNWLENVLSDLHAQPGPRQAALARRTVNSLKVEDARALRVAKPRAEPTVSIHTPILERHRELEWMNYDQTPNYR